jgi:hypothetical protein
MENEVNSFNNIVLLNTIYPILSFQPIIHTTTIKDMLYILFHATFSKSDDYLRLASQFRH